ncbi:hypothetical protein PN419_00490 [Halorubrum ezzemoulense]|nr:hypothetical protein [Halorubrum ezzemoulense]MDB9247485.1 hypothetical protein [Halorubrum ezzemoulense]MDB9258606.1 hypothetical protein [Halorubrum ezzemoulense]MDB9264535.1 hypothetical protein [Halorubrum ezzemoulense]MDB9268967.1 hypothetical protein [Halorubrum ezzemoulense]MDB9271503.1 hypothetical protein [Halorubrum ezzemoulense]
MKVTAPIDKTDLDYALEEVIEEARANDLDDDQIRERLDAYERAIKRGDV